MDSSEVVRLRLIPSSGLSSEGRREEVGETEDPEAPTEDEGGRREGEGAVVAAAVAEEGDVAEEGSGPWKACEWSWVMYFERRMVLKVMACWRSSRQ